MPTRNANAIWEGDLKEGKGQMALGSGAFDGAYSYPSRFENGKGANPEELIGAALAGCFSMQLSNGLTQAGHKPQRVETNAKVNFDKAQDGFKISSITLNAEARVPGIDEKKFMEQAQAAKKSCPVSQALSGTEIKLDAKLLS